MIKDLAEKEDILHLTIGHAVKIGTTDYDETIWNVMDVELDEFYLLVGDEVNDLEPFIDTEFYKLRWAIEQTKKRHQF